MRRFSEPLELWRCLYQLARVLHMIQSKSPVFLVDDEQFLGFFIY